MLESRAAYMWRVRILIRQYDVCWMSVNNPTTTAENKRKNTIQPRSLATCLAFSVRTQPVSTPRTAILNMTKGRVLIPDASEADQREAQLRAG